MKKYTYILFLILFVFSISIEVFAMTSTRYRIDTDSLNFAGTEGSVSADFLLSDTLGEVGTSFSSSTRYTVSAGYRTLQSSYISISTVSDITIPNIGGLTAIQSTSSGTWLVKTDNFAGYTMSVRTLTTPALKSSEGASFADYSPVTTGVPDYTYTVGSGESNFAFSPEGLDISQKYLDNGASCNTGSSDTSDKCWDGFSTTSKIIVNRASSNHPNGTNTTVRLRVGIGSNKVQDAGTYTSDIVITAVVL